MDSPATDFISKTFSLMKDMKAHMAAKVVRPESSVPIWRKRGGLGFEEGLGVEEEGVGG